MAKPKAPKSAPKSKPIRGKSYDVDYESLDNPPAALMRHIDPLYRHPVESETIRGRQVQKLQEAVQSGGDKLKSVGDHFAFVAAQADPNKPGADFTNLAPYMEALEQLPLHQRKIILEAAGNPAVFAPVLDKEMPALTIGQGDTSWADDLFGGEASPATAEPEQPVFASSLGDVQDPDTQPGVVYSDVYEDRGQHPPEYRYSTYAGSDVARDNFRLEGRAARASGGLENHPLIYDQMQELARIKKAGFEPTLPPPGVSVPLSQIENDPVRGAHIGGHPQIMTVGTGVVGTRQPLWGPRKPLSVDIEVERRMRPALDKTVSKIEELADRAAYGDAEAIVDLDRLYPRWRAVLPEVDAAGNVTPATRPPSGQLLGGLIANAANIGDPTFPERVAGLLDRSIQAQASLPPSTDMARKYAAMQLTPSRDGIKYLSGIAQSGQPPFPFFADTNVPAYRAAPEAADWADDLFGASDPATGQIDAGEAWADQLFAEEAASAAGEVPPSPAGDAGWADQLDAPAPQAPSDGGMGWADESFGTDFAAPEPQSPSDTNWADDFSMYGGPATQGFAALDTMNRRRANPLAALLA
jgi:hypothetical protein